MDFSKAKLTDLYEFIKKIGSCSNLNELMDASSRYAANILEVKACSIKLLDDKRKYLKFTSSYGLSEGYISKGPIDIEKSPINREVLQGSRYVIGNIEEKDYFQYSEDIRKEGIASMLCLPLKVENRIFGISCVYSEESNRFVENDFELFSLITDITALAIENLRGELTKFWFIMKAAHQLRSPLNTIYTMLKLIYNKNLGSINERQEETIDRCLKRIEILGKLINDLLKLGEKRTEAAKPKIYPVHPTKILRQLMDLFTNQANEKGLDIQLLIQDDIPRVLGNERLLDELFTNLISNAIKYTPKGGKVVVKLFEEGIYRVKFEVSDTGIGISEEDMPKLFTEFFRTESAKALNEEGSGLGLVIVKEILDRTGGTIEVKSEVGKGTSFSCQLPSLLKLRPVKANRTDLSY
ncbi:MAG: GAF domain-containing sensor histidine kinase [Pseudomonadota bacterium]